MNIRQLLSGALALASLAVAPDCVRADDQPVEIQVVDAMNKLFGTHPGFRANHAKGIVAAGTFTASPAASGLSRAALFNGQAIPVTVRFSDATGIPDLPDGAASANPHGMAIKYHLANGGDVDMIMNSLKFFPIATGQEFVQLLLAAAASPPGTPKPTPIQKFMAAHPRAPAALASTATPESYAAEEYNGIDAFVLVDKAGKEQAVRFRMVPEHLVHIAPEAAAKRPPNFLSEDLANRLIRGVVTYRLEAQLAGSGDSTKDPTRPWPADRKRVELGVLKLDRIVPNSVEAQRKLVFLPGSLSDGIKPSDDPLIDVRNGAYYLSYTRRTE